MRIRHSAALTTVLCLAVTGLAQQPGSAGKLPARPTPMTVTKTVKAGEIAAPFTIPIECDQDGALYLRTDVDGYPAIHKVNQDGAIAAKYTASSCSELKVQISGEFSVTANGHVYQIVFPREERGRYVVDFEKDGTCHSKIKLDTGFPFVPYQIVAFPSGNFLIAGLRWSADRQVQAMWPFTALFASSGAVLKEIEFADDAELHKLGAQGDLRVSSAGNPGSNSAVAHGAMELGDDGNAYLMRTMSPAIVYAISEGGNVVRRFTVDGGDADLVPSSMHVGGGRLAILFRNPRTNYVLVKIVDLQGREVAAYEEPTDNGHPQLGLAFACYQPSPDRLTFLTTFDDSTLGFKVAAQR